MKECFYFPHDYNARGDVNVVRMRRMLGWSAYGLYWALIEKSGEEGNNGRLRFEDVDDIAYDFHTDQDTLMRIIGEFDLFSRDEDGIFFWSKRFVDHLKKRQKLSTIRAEYGKKGGLAKAKQLVKLNVAKERKGKERKVNLYSASAEDIKTSKLLFKKLWGINPAFRAKFKEDSAAAKKTAERWAEDISMLRRIDKATTQQIELVITYIFGGEIHGRTFPGDTFWQPNIMSGKKLRKQFMVLVGKIGVEVKKEEESKGLTIDR